MLEKKLPQTQLWVGQTATVMQEVTQFLQEMLCKQGACKQCLVCSRIAARQHANVVWLAPEKNQYTKADCEIIGHISSFMLEADEHFFFIITAAETLTPAVANSLLKNIEEPPRGYHFILCAERPGMLLPTIVSRCVVRKFDAVSEQGTPQFLNFFKEPAHTQLVPFAQFFETAAISEQMTTALLDELICFWRTVYHAGDQKRAYAAAVIDQLLHAYQYLPMPGSSKLFWRNLLCNLVMLPGARL